MIVAARHEFVWVTGGEAAAFLDGLVSQSVGTMEPGTVRRSLLLSPQGKLRAPLWVARGKERIGLVTDLGYGERVADDLARFRLRVDAVIDRGDERLVEVWGERAGELVAAQRWTEDPDLCIDLPLLFGGTRRVLFADAEVDTAEARAEAMRIEHGEPRMGVDIDDSTIVQEAFLVDGAVDFTKGCYLGQELVARIDSRGHVNRHLRGLVADTVLTAGTTIVADGEDVGSITSAAVSDLLGPIALGTVRRTVEPGTHVTAGGIPAVVRALPLR